MSGGPSLSGLGPLLRSHDLSLRNYRGADSVGLRRRDHCPESCQLGMQSRLRLARDRGDGSRRVIDAGGPEQVPGWQAVRERTGRAAPAAALAQAAGHSACSRAGAL